MICPKGHNSTESDFCSECGAKIVGVGIAEIGSNPTNRTTPTATAASVPCPDCSTPHDADSGNFCEICGFNFLTGTKGGDPLSIFPPPIRSSASILYTAPTQRPPQPASTSNPAIEAVKQWQIVVSIDPSLARSEERRVGLDDAISSRHAILTLHPDGSLVLRDIGSSNGTMVNGREIAVMSDIAIASGDEITLGHWTRIKLIDS